MKTRDLKLTLNQAEPDREGGTVLIIDTLGANTAIDITWLDKDGQERGTVKGAIAGRKYVPGFEFGGYKLLSPVTQDVRLLVGPVGSDATDINQTGNANITNPVTAPVNTRERLGTVLADVAPVAITDAGVQILAADSTRRGVRLKNAGANDVAIVAAAGTAFANAAVVLLPGETWNEETGPGCAIFGKCAAGLASTINIQRVSE